MVDRDERILELAAERRPLGAEFIELAQEVVGKLVHAEGQGSGCGDGTHNDTRRTRSWRGER